jgi:hypothetical protein
MATAQPTVATLSAAGAGRAVWLVAVRELTDQLTSLRFLIILKPGATPKCVTTQLRTS